MPKNVRQQQKKVTSSRSQPRQRKPRATKRLSTVSSAPRSIATSTTSTQPSSVMSGGMKLVKFREFINSYISSGTDYQIHEHFKFSPLGPQNPWLKNEAIGWERYVVKSLSFVLESTAGTDKQGSSLMCIDYDPTDLVPSDLRSILNNQTSRVSSVWKSSGIKASPTAINDFTKTLFVDEHADRSSSPCSFTLASDGVPSGTDLGRLYVEYELCFKIQQMRKISVDPMVNCYCASATVNLPAVGPNTQTRKVSNNLSFEEDPNGFDMRVLRDNRYMLEVNSYSSFTGLNPPIFADASVDVIDSYYRETGDRTLWRVIFDALVPDVRVNTIGSWLAGPTTHFLSLFMVPQVNDYFALE